MPRLFVIFRSFDRIWTCKTYTREIAPFEFDESNGPVKLLFTVDPIALKTTATTTDTKQQQQQYEIYPQGHFSCFSSLDRDLYCTPHENFPPRVLKVKQEVPTTATNDGAASSSSSSCCPSYSNVRDRRLLRRYSCSEPDPDDLIVPEDSEEQDEVMYYVVPVFKCTLVADAHVSCCLSNELSRSRAFRKRFLRCVRRSGGFRSCMGDYSRWTEEEQEMWDNYLKVPYMIDVVTVWPRQKIDYPWDSKINYLLGLHIALDEGFAWLSTLGGAHSALGETFIKHAETAGNISKKQLRISLLLGNQQMIARCFVFWSWSLMQRGELARCKRCIRNIWSYAGRLPVKDWILENMCKAVWSRLMYKKSLLKRKTTRKPCKTFDRGDPHSDDDPDGKNDLSGGSTLHSCPSRRRSQSSEQNDFKKFEKFSPIDPRDLYVQEKTSPSSSNTLDANANNVSSLVDIQPPVLHKPVVVY